MIGMWADVITALCFLWSLVLICAATFDSDSCTLADIAGSDDCNQATAFQDALWVGRHCHVVILGVDIGLVATAVYCDGADQGFGVPHNSGDSEAGDLTSAQCECGELSCHCAAVCE